MKHSAGGYVAPTLSDYGDFVELTGHKGPDGAEDGCGKTTDGAVCSPPQ